MKLRSCQSLNELISRGEVSKSVMEAAFGLPVDAIFSQFDEVPIASGSIGQIHRATLSAVGGTVTGLKENTQVAVKVRRSINGDQLVM